MIKPDAHLKKLIAQSTPAQQRNAIRIAALHVLNCRRMGIEPMDRNRLLAEALQMQDDAEVAIEIAQQELLDYYTSRSYKDNYREP
jgi:hypothetical protein